MGVGRRDLEDIQYIAKLIVWRVQQQTSVSHCLSKWRIIEELLAIYIGRSSFQSTDGVLGDVFMLDFVMILN